MRGGMEERGEQVEVERASTTRRARAGEGWRAGRRRLGRFRTARLELATYEGHLHSGARRKNPKSLGSNPSTTFQKLVVSSRGLGRLVLRRPFLLAGHRRVCSPFAAGPEGVTGAARTRAGCTS